MWSQEDFRALLFSQWANKEFLFNKFRVLLSVMYQDAVNEYAERRPCRSE